MYIFARRADMCKTHIRRVLFLYRVVCTHMTLALLENKNVHEIK
jgi:hypothetical protein